MSNDLHVIETPTEFPKPITVWAFAWVDDEDARRKVCESLKSGKSRFGWSQDDKHNLKGGIWTDWHSKQLFLLQIKAGDWIVHVNTPHWGECTAVQVTGEYEFDGGLACSWGTDFRHCIPVDAQSLIKFDRRDPNVLPTVNLNPRQRYHRVYAVEDFLKSLDNIRRGSVVLKESETRELFHFRDKTRELLAKITALLQGTHRSKNLERFFATVFRKLPGVVDVNENGFGWRTDNGADLILTVQSMIAITSLEHRVVVQIKSFTDDHYSLAAIDEVIKGMKQYDAIAGIIITTARKTEQLETAIYAAAEQIGKPIDLIAGDEVAKFIIKHAPELVFDLNPT
jgi:hypothetical protein